MKLNTNENQGKENLNNERENGLNTEEGKWVTCKLTPQELSHIVGIKMQWNSLGLKLPYSKILRQIVAKGFGQIDWEAIKVNPMALFKEAA